MDDFSWGATRQVSGPTHNNDVSSNKSTEDETIFSDGSSPRGFEVVDSGVIDADEYDSRGARGNAGRSKTKHSHPASPQSNRDRRHHTLADVDEEAGTLHLKPKLHSSVPVDIDDVSADEFSCEVTTTSGGTKFDPSKYRSADEAKRIRRMRRGEC